MVQRCKPDLTDTEIGMSVFGGSLFVLAVVDMENCDLILAEGFVKLIQDEIRICCEIISCVVDVAGIEADAQPVRKTDTVIDWQPVLQSVCRFRSLCLPLFPVRCGPEKAGKALRLSLR